MNDLEKKAMLTAAAAGAVLAAALAYKSKIKKSKTLQKFGHGTQDEVEKEIADRNITIDDIYRIYTDQQFLQKKE